MSSWRLGTLEAKPPPQSSQLAAKESTMEELCNGEHEEVRRPFAVVHEAHWRTMKCIMNFIIQVAFILQSMNRAFILQNSYLPHNEEV